MASLWQHRPAQHTQSGEEALSRPARLTHVVLADAALSGMWYERSAHDFLFWAAQAVLLMPLAVVSHAHEAETIATESY